MVGRDALRKYVRGSLWVLPSLSVLTALAAGAALSSVSVGPRSPLAFQGTPDDARTLLLGITGTMITIIALLLGLAGLYTVGVSGGNRTAAFPRLAVSGVIVLLFTSLGLLPALGIRAGGAAGDAAAVCRPARRVPAPAAQGRRARGGRDDAGVDLACLTR